MSTPSAKPATAKSVTRPSILSLSINSKSALYASYMPHLRHGGLFIPTNRKYGMGDELFMLLTLLNDPAKLPVAGKVAWITPEGAQGNRPQGVGIHFNNDEGGREVKRRIEVALAGVLTSSRPTHTL
ncbi:MAG: PilZ domain-containing protein [Zoogloeaceae bacterium]|jgi:type IV pilus assembly protein PilZ|nr:PilZ domain-containing protein [Zoogloeaceae bacterium]